MIVPKMDYTVIAEKYEALERKCKQNADQIKDKENMIYSLNQKVERVLLNADAFKPDPLIESEFSKAGKMTILNQINSVIVDICMHQLSEKMADMWSSLSERIMKIEEQLKEVQFSLLCKAGRFQRSNSIDEQVGKISNQKILDQLESGILTKISALNENSEVRVHEKIASISNEIEAMKREMQAQTACQTQISDCNNLKANINAMNQKPPKHERRPSAGKLLSDIFSWKRSNTVSFSNLMQDENSNGNKFQDVFGTEIQEIGKKFETMIEEMKIYFKGNDSKLKKVIENSSFCTEEAKKMRASMQDIERFKAQTAEKLSKVRGDCESNCLFFEILLSE